MERKKTRNSKGSGGYWVKNGRYYWKIRYTDVLTGIHKSKTISHKSKSVLNKMVKEFLQSIKNDGGHYEKLTVSEWLEKWLKKKQLMRKPKTYQNYEGICRTHIIPVLGNFRIQKLRREHVQNLLNEISKERKPHTVASVKRVFSVAMNDAVNEGIIDSNPVRHTETPTVNKKLPVSLEQDNMMKLFELAYSGAFLPPVNNRLDSKYIRKEYFVALCLSMATGIRKGELLGLTWDRIKDCSIKVDRALEAVGNVERLSSTKSDSSVRYIQIPDAIINLLMDWKKEQVTYANMLGEHYNNPLGLVFTNAAGGFVNASNLYKRWWNPLRIAAGMPKFRWHNLRSASLTFFASHGVDIRTVGRMAGHSEPRTTYLYYLGVMSPQEKRRLEVADDLAKLILPPTDSDD